MDLNSIIPKSVDPDLAQQLENELSGIEEFLSDHVEDEHERKRSRKHKHERTERTRKHRKIIESVEKSGFNNRKIHTRDMSDDTDEYEYDESEHFKHNDSSEDESECEIITDDRKKNKPERTSVRTRSRNDSYFKYNNQTGLIENEPLEVPPVQPFPYKTVLIIVLVLVVMVLTGCIMYKIIKQQIVKRNINEANRILNETLYSTSSERIPMDTNKDDVYTNINDAKVVRNQEVFTPSEINKYMQGAGRASKSVDYNKITQSNIIKQKLIEQIAEEDDENTSVVESEPEEEPVQTNNKQVKPFWYYRWLNKKRAANAKYKNKSGASHDYITKKSVQTRDAKGRFVSKK